MQKQNKPKKTKVVAASTKSITEAVKILEDGGVIAFPTETVYGLGADATNPQAVARIFTTKQRPAINPLIVHVSNVDQAMRIAKFDQRAKALARFFWPGPLTFILPLMPGHRLADSVTAGLETVGIRCPSNRIASDLLRNLDFPVAAPSANKSGQLSPTRAIHVAEDFADDGVFILAGDEVDIGLESTILDLSVETPVILREGGIGPEDLAPYLDNIIMAGEDTDDAPKSPGRLLRHYAPSIPLRLNAVDVTPTEALLAFGDIRFMGIKGGGFARDLPERALRNLSETGDLNEAASNLYAHLHELEKSGRQTIAVMPVPDKGIGRAINDRLRRAAADQAEKNKNRAR